MIVLIFLATWAVRSAAIALTAALLLTLFRVKDPSVRLAAWTTAMAGSLLMPVLTLALPAVTLPELPRYRSPATTRMEAARVSGAPSRMPYPALSAFADISGARRVPRWPLFPIAMYCLGAAALLLRLAAGLLLTRRLIRRSRPTGSCLPGEIPIHESYALTVPAALGPLRPLIVLPMDYRALLWYSPVSWWMHNRIVRLAEEASDDAALAAIKDRVSYAETLLQFMQRGMRIAHWEGVAMARYGKADERIHRILDGTAISRGLTRYGLAIILLLGAPVVFLAAAAAPQDAPQAPAAPPAPMAPQSPIAPAAPQAPSAPAVAAHNSSRVTRYLIVDGDSSTGSWESRDELRYKEWRSRYGSSYAWFRQDGREYIINDEHTLARFQEAMAPQREVNRRQADVNRHQEAVNRLQEAVNRRQETVNRAQEDVNQQQNLVNQGSQDQARVNQLQAEVNSKQETVNAEQTKVNREQAVVNREQDVVNQMQSRASAVIDKALQALFDSARRQGLAHEVH